MVSSKKRNASETSTVHKIQDFVHLGVASGQAVRPGLRGREQAWCRQGYVLGKGSTPGKKGPGGCVCLACPRPTEQVKFKDTAGRI